MKKLILALVIIFLAYSIKAADDLALTDAFIKDYFLSYYKMPIPQAQNLTCKAYLDNIGSYDHTGVYVNLKVINSSNDTVYDNNSPVITVVSGTTDSIEISTPFNAPAVDTYTFLFVMYQDSVDAIPGNNTATQSIQVTEFLYQRDDGSYSGTNGWIGSTSNYELGNIYEFLNVCQITSASVVVDSSTEIGAQIFFSLYDYDLFPVASTPTHFIDSDDLGDTVTLFFSPPLVTDPLSYYVGMVGNTGTKQLKVQMAQYSPDFTSLYTPDQIDWFYVNSTPTVRLGINQTSTSLGESEELDWSFYPNPAQGVIRLTSPTDQKMNYRIFDFTGRILQAGAVMKFENVDISNLKSGSYLIQIGHTSKTMIVY